MVKRGYLNRGRTGQFGSAGSLECRANVWIHRCCTASSLSVRWIDGLGPRHHTQQVFQERLLGTKWAENLAYKGKTFLSRPPQPDICRTLLQPFSRGGNVYRIFLSRLPCIEIGKRGWVARGQGDISLCFKDPLDHCYDKVTARKVGIRNLWTKLRLKQRTK